MTGLARELKVPVNEYANRQRSTALNAMLRCVCHATLVVRQSSGINLQTAYDLRVTIHSSASRIERECVPASCVALLIAFQPFLFS